MRFSGTRPITTTWGSTTARVTGKSIAVSLVTCSRSWNASNESRSRTVSNRLFTFDRAVASPADLVAYWSATYSYQEEHRYTDNIHGPRTPEGLRELFKWKVGKRFEASHMPAIERHFVSRM